jgi:superfamily II DNA or RNA helicase
MTDIMSQSIRYEQGTILVEGFDGVVMSKLEDWVIRDQRTLEWRAEGRRYREIALTLRDCGVVWKDNARSYELLKLPLRSPINPRSHQAGAIEAWTAAGRRGVVSLPTGAGKTILAVMCMAAVGRPTLICVPTIDLMQQWHLVMTKYFDTPIGLLGGGSHQIETVTIATYDSAAMHAERLGPKFGLAIFDECHHLPAPGYAQIAQCLIAPFRLGLSATVERADGREEVLFDLVGDIIFEGRFSELEEKTLAPYKVVQIEVDMTAHELARYNEARTTYKNFLKYSRINFSDGNGWSQFIALSARSTQGRNAMKAYREQKRLAQAASGKLTELWKVLQIHRGERVIVFTDENSLAYQIGRDFFVPVLTHHTKPPERAKILEGFKKGEVTVIATSKVLNEGVDVPEASIGVVLSGSGTVREHVQRLGRILRHKEGKSAVLYEIISRGTSETYVNQRRRQHYAYQGSGSGYRS